MRAALLLAVLFLTACGTPAPVSAPSTVAIEHKFGRTEIKARPARVVSLGLTDQDVMLALGIRPVGATDWFGERPYGKWPWSDGKWGADRPEVVSDGNSVNYEKVAQLRPDLIIGQYAGITREQYDNLSRIAPTVAQNGRYEDYSAPWRETTATIGKALGRETEARKLIADTDARLARIRADHPEFVGRRIIVADSPAPGRYGAFAPLDPRVVLLSELGFTVDPKLDGQTRDGKPIMFGDERLDLVDTDILVWLPEKPDDINRIKNAPVYRNLDVAKADRAVFLPYADPPTGAALTFATVLSIPYAFDQAIPELSTAARKGNR